jgi:hypothetical protein
VNMVPGVIFTTLPFPWQHFSPSLMKHSSLLGQRLSCEDDEVL